MGSAVDGGKVKYVMERVLITDPFIKEKRRQANIQSDNIDLEALGWKKV